MSPEAQPRWQNVRLGDIVAIERSSKIVSEIHALDRVTLFSLPAFDDGGRPVEVAGDTIESSKYVVPGDCVLFSKLNPRIPRVWRVRHSSSTPTLGSTEFWPLKPRDRDVVDLDYLAHFLRSSAFLRSPSILPASSTNSHQRVDRSAFEGYELALPPLAEQRRIAEILFSVDEAIQATQAVIVQTRKVKEGVLQRLLTRGIGHTRFKQTKIGEIPASWQVKPLGEVTDFVTSGSRGWAKYYDTEGSFFIRSQNIRDSRLDFSDRQHVQVPPNVEGSRTLVRARDVLITITGNGVGNVAEAPDNLGAAFVSQHVGLARLHDPRMASMVVAYLSPSGPGNAQIIAAQYGQSKPGLSLKSIREIDIPIPPMEEVLQITEAIVSIDNNSRCASHKLVALKDFRTALATDLLTGRRRVSTNLLLAAE